MNLQPLSPFSGPARYWIVLSAALLITSSAHSQSASLSLASASTAPGGSVSLNLSLNGSSGMPAGLQWTLSYASSDVLSVSIAAGPALTAASKSLTCSPKSGSVTCLASGMNGTAIGSGVVAAVAVTLTSTSASAVSLPIPYVMGAQPDGSFSTVSATGG